MQFKTIFLALLLTVSFQASAVCFGEDLIGYWDYYEAEEGVAANCSFRISANGNVTLHRFGCLASDGTQTIPFDAVVSGNLKIDSFCHVTGQVVVDGVLTEFPKATLNRSRDVITGIAATGSQPGHDASHADFFHMAKFY